MHILCTFLFNAFIHLLHPFYIAMTDINYNKQDKALEISVRIFTDDFENALRKQHTNVNIDILHPANQEQMNGFVKDYIQQNLHIAIDNEPATISFAGYEQQQESIWAYFEIKNIAQVQKLAINNALLYDYSKEQSNMIHVKVNDKEQTTKLNYPDKMASFTF